MIALLMQMGVKSAEDMTLEEACKAQRRMRRGVESSGISLAPATLAARDLRRRRAKNTHKGKR
jgi:hypothetical protein